jgi:hypothetical protein
MLMWPSPDPAAAGALVAASPAKRRREEFLSLAEELLADWCGGMLACQLRRPGDHTSNGALWSPGDNTMLGRGVDAVYPFLWYAHKTEDERFRDAAVAIMDWTNRNLSLPDGSWKNGLQENWQGITVFTATSIAEALKYHGCLLESTTRQAWEERLSLAAEWLYRTIDIEYSNINYPIANAYAMAILGRVLGETRYSARARELAHAALGCFTPRDRLLAGEGGRPSATSKKGCYAVDLAYNVEESLPSLTLYGLMENDSIVLDQVAASLRAHAEFMLPDGGWDDSWGTRNFKWTWWGSRATMGCQTAYALMADRDPFFHEVAYRNMRLLRECTKDGVLYGGPHNIAKGDTPSLHHTTTHAKCLATVLDIGVPLVAECETTLPCDAGDRLREFQDVATWLVSRGPWRATLTTYDWPFNKWSHPSGGALSLLWHRRVGLLAVASMTIFRRVERWDMQDEAGPGFGTLTPRVQFSHRPGRLREVWSRLRWGESARKTYMSVLDNSAELEVDEHPWGITARATASLVDHMRASPRTGEVKCITDYAFRSDELKMSVAVQGMGHGEDVTLVFPVTSKPGERIERASDGSALIHKAGGVVHVSSSKGFDTTAPEDRIFSYVPGVACVPLAVTFSGRAELTLRVVGG